MATKDTFDLQTQQVLLNFISLMPIPSSHDNLPNEFSADERFESTPKSFLPERSSTGLTVFKRKNQLLLYRTSSTPSSTRSSSHSQNSTRSDRKVSDIHEHGDFFYDQVDASKNEDSLSSDLPRPSDDEIQAAPTYVDIREEEGTLSNEIQSIQKDLQEKEIQKKEGVTVGNNKNDLLSRSFKRSMLDTSTDQQLIVSPAQELDSVPIEVGIRLRIVGDQLEQQYHSQLETATTELIQWLNDPRRFQEEFLNIVQRLESLTETGWQTIALICTLTQRLMIKCGSNLRLVFDVASSIISSLKRTFIEEQGGWNNNLGIEEIQGSSVDRPHANNPANNNDI